MLLKMRLMKISLLACNDVTDKVPLVVVNFYMRVKLRQRIKCIGAVRDVAQELWSDVVLHMRLKMLFRGEKFLANLAR